MKYLAILFLSLLVGCSGLDSFRFVANVKLPPPGGDLQGKGGDGNGDPTPKPKPAELTLSFSNYDFGLRSVYSYTNQSFVLRNIGEQEATGVSIGALSGAFSWNSQVTNPCPSIAPGASCEVLMTYHPTDLTQSQNAFSVAYVSNGVSKTSDVNVRGEGNNVALLTISDGTLNNFTNLGTIAQGSAFEKAFDVLYAGAVDATGVSFSIQAPFTLVNDPAKSTCGTTVRAKCKITISYPSSTVGIYSSILKVGYSNSAYPAQDTHEVRAETVATQIPATLTLNGGTPFSFGKRLKGIPHSANIPVGFSGTLPARIISASVSGSGFSVTNNCVDSFSSNCSLTLGFNSAQIGFFGETLSLVYETNGQTKTATLAVSATAVNKAVITISPIADPYEFGMVSVNQRASATFSLTNAANALDATGLAFSGLSGVFGTTPGSPTCGSTLSSGNTCRINIWFQPSALNTFQGSLRIAYFDGVDNQQRFQNVRGAGSSQSSLAIPTSILDFGNVNIGTTKTLAWPVKYYGTQAISILSISTIGLPFSFAGGAYPGTGGTCGTTVTADCTLMMSFSPTAVGTFTQPLNIMYMATGASSSAVVQVSMRGNGVNPAAVLAFADGASVSFGNVVVNTIATKTLIVRKSGPAAATAVTASVVLPFRFAGGSYPGTGGTCGATVSADCTLVVEFAPTVVAPQVKVMTLNYYDGNATRAINLTLNGTGVGGANITLTSSGAGRTKVGTTKNFDVVVKNEGAAATSGLVIDALPVPEAPFALVSNDCPGILAPGASSSCTVSISFSPTAPGPRSKAFSVRYMDGVSSTAAIRSLTLTGTGTIPVAQIATNGDHTCAITPEADVKCWGKNNYQQLGLGDTTYRGDSNDPSHRVSPQLATVNMGFPNDVKQIAVGYWHTCALNSTGEIRCWGWNDAGQLGTLTPMTRANIGSAPLRAKSVVAGYAHTCAILSNDQVKCWGQNQQGQLGLGDTVNRGLDQPAMGNSLPTVELGSGLSALQIVADTGHTCALLSDHSVKCWGDNFYGQLGLGDFEARGDELGEMGDALPSVNLGTGRSAVAISAGGASTCAILDNGSVKCWGYNYNGNLGKLWCQNQNEQVGDCDNSAMFPFQLYGYGTKPGQMGDALPAINLGTGRTAKAISSGGFSTCVILENDEVKCWGDNYYGQLGLGDTAPRGIHAGEMGNNLFAVQIGLEKPKVLSAGGTHACVVLESDAIKCWGDNRFGALGQNDINHRGDEPGEMGSSLLPIPWY